MLHAKVIERWVFTGDPNTVAFEVMESSQASLYSSPYVRPWLFLQGAGQHTVYMTAQYHKLFIVKVFPFITWNKQTVRGEISAGQRTGNTSLQAKVLSCEQTLAWYISLNIYLRWYNCPCFSIDHQLQYGRSWIRLIMYVSPHSMQKRKQQWSDNSLSLLVRYWHKLYQIKLTKF